MGISRISAQDVKSSSATTSISATYPNTPTSGDLLLATVFASGGINSPFSSPGWTLVKSEGTGTTNIAILYKVSGGNEGTVTISSGVGTSAMKLHLYEFQGVTNPVVIDGVPSVGSIGSVTGASTSTYTTKFYQDLVVAVFGVSVTVASATILTFSTLGIDTSAVRLMDGDTFIINTAIYRCSAIWTGSATAVSIIVAFEAYLPGIMQTKSWWGDI